MLRKRELELIERKFKKYLTIGKIIKPKQNKKLFFKKKAESSFNLATELLNNETYLDWVINISYYSMYYNAISLLAHFNVDLEEIDESTHVLTYQALVYFFYVRDQIIETHYLEDFKQSLQESDKRLKTIAKQKSTDILACYKNARDQRGKMTYELGNIAELKAAKTAIRRAESFDILVERMM